MNFKVSDRVFIILNREFRHQGCALNLPALVVSAKVVSISAETNSSELALDSSEGAVRIANAHVYTTYAEAEEKALAALEAIEKCVAQGRASIAAQS